jgi:hypothetical protein
MQILSKAVRRYRSAKLKVRNEKWKTCERFVLEKYYKEAYSSSAGSKSLSNTHKKSKYIITETVSVNRTAL